MDASADIVEKLRAEAGRLDEDCSYNSTGHFITAQRWQKIEYWLDLPAVVLTALSAFFAFTDYAVAAGVLSIVVLFLTTVSLFLHPGDRASRHKSAGERYLSLRNMVRFYAEIEVTGSGRSKQWLSDELRGFVERKNELNSDSPHLPDYAYEKAKLIIAAGGASYAVDEWKRLERK